ncbi:MAG: magnesium transporter CorA family protein, partial [Candidatus Pacebacteria bacterium]|nr:magnesium transporter CorA family protein [Candidatus Paceibacterota bacterium]
ILTIPTMVFSFYGMNVHLPLESHPLAFGFIIAGTVIFSVLLLIYFNLKDLL